MSHTLKNLFGLNFTTGTENQIRQTVLNLNSNLNSGKSVIFANAHVIVEAKENPTFMSELKTATTIVADGKPLAMMLNTPRYSGPDFMVDFLNQTQSFKHFFIGSTPEVLSALKQKFKHVQINTYSPPFEKEFTDNEKQKQIALIKNFNSDFIWVSLGAPKQEKYVLEMSQKAAFGTWLAVGAAFDFISGNKPRAPKVLQNMGLEWAFRLATEPRRLAIRYLKTNPAFVALCLKELTSLSKK